MLQIHTIPAFQDNYIWMLHQPGDARAIVVDPGDAAPVKKALEKLGLTLAGILVTHQHPDHIGGIPTLLAQYAVPVYGPADIPVVDQPVKDGDTIRFPFGNVSVLAVPGHTLNHLAYFCSDGPQNGPVLFCGDTLFAAGCGRLFEGTAEQMYQSLEQIKALPDNTQIYCAHEYTLANLRFALTVDPDNKLLQKRLQHCTGLRDQAIPTVPFSLQEDKQTNPFLRSDNPTICHAAAQRGASDTPVSVFAAIRGWKDSF